MYAQSFLLEFFKGVPFMTNEEIYDVSGGSDDFDVSNIEKSEKLVHWISLFEGFYNVKNSNGSKFFLGTFSSDVEAHKAIHSVMAAIMNDYGDEEINELCVKLDKCLPMVDGIKYVMSLEEAYYLSKTHRSMDDIYFHEGALHLGAPLMEYASGRFAS
jgi:hypothetical protein